MSTLNYLGLFILIWLSFGIMVVVKSLYIDKIFEPDNLEKLKEQMLNDGYTPHEIEISCNKRNFIVANILGGILSFIADTRDTFSNKR